MRPSPPDHPSSRRADERRRGHAIAGRGEAEQSQVAKPIARRDTARSTESNRATLAAESDGDKARVAADGGTSAVHAMGDGGYQNVIDPLAQDGMVAGCHMRTERLVAPT
jgi:hypothetical protein